jgi:predicted RNase H-like nuclease (RuvC/YqgF family)
LHRGVEARKRGPKSDPTREVRHENEKLERQMARLKEENRQLRLIVAAQKKIAEMFPETSASDE